MLINQFSWNEMGKFDAPAMIDHILNVTGHDKLYYIGFSMGNTIFFTMMHHRPEYNEKVRFRNQTRQQISER